MLSDTGSLRCPRCKRLRRVEHPRVTCARSPLLSPRVLAGEDAHVEHRGWLVYLRGLSWAERVCRRVAWDLTLCVLKYKPWLSSAAEVIAQICFLYRLYKRSGNLRWYSLRSVVGLGKAELTLTANVTLQIPHSFLFFKLNSKNKKVHCKINWILDFQLRLSGRWESVQALFIICSLDHSKE